MTAAVKRFESEFWDLYYTKLIWENSIDKERSNSNLSVGNQTLSIDSIVAHLRQNKIHDNHVNEALERLKKFETKIIRSNFIESVRTKLVFEANRENISDDEIFTDLRQGKIKINGDNGLELLKKFDAELPSKIAHYRQKFFDELKKVIETNFGRKSIFLQSTVLDAKEIEKLESAGFDKHIFWFSEAVNKLKEEPTTLIKKIENGEIDLINAVIDNDFYKLNKTSAEAKSLLDKFAETKAAALNEVDYIKQYKELDGFFTKNENNKEKYDSSKETVFNQLLATKAAKENSDQHIEWYKKFDKFVEGKDILSKPHVYDFELASEPSTKIQVVPCPGFCKKNGVLCFIICLVLACLLGFGAGCFIFGNSGVSTDKVYLTCGENIIDSSEVTDGNRVTFLNGCSDTITYNVTLQYNNAPVTYSVSSDTTFLIHQNCDTIFPQQITLFCEQTNVAQIVSRDANNRYIRYIHCCEGGSPCPPCPPIPQPNYQGFVNEFIGYVNRQSGNLTATFDSYLTSDCIISLDGNSQSLTAFQNSVRAGRIRGINFPNNDFDCVYSLAVSGGRIRGLTGNNGSPKFTRIVINTNR